MTDKYLTIHNGRKQETLDWPLNEIPREREIVIIKTIQYHVLRIEYNLDENTIIIHVR